MCERLVEISDFQQLSSIWPPAYQEVPAEDANIIWDNSERVFGGGCFNILVRNQKRRPNKVGSLPPETSIGGAAFIVLLP